MTIHSERSGNGAAVRAHLTRGRRRPQEISFSVWKITNKPGWKYKCANSIQVSCFYKTDSWHKAWFSSITIGKYPCNTLNGVMTASLPILSPPKKLLKIHDRIISWNVVTVTDNSNTSFKVDKTIKYYGLTAVVNAINCITRHNLGTFRENIFLAL